MEGGIAGEYYMEGQREMASGFLLRPDGSFQFFFTYGAMDRFGSGKWSVKDSRVTFNSRVKPLYDYVLMQSSANSSDFTTIKMDVPNPALLRHVFCSLQKGVEGSWEQMSQEGDIQFPKQEVESVSLLFEFCPERFSIIPVHHPGHNEFTFRFEPTIMEVFFEIFSLQVDPGGLSGRHPLMEGDQFRYPKQ
ncbi:MAG: hypothetical protein H7Y01_03585 [Ferruginibacter sp.]|nr:hypothetical protein [Chitinophagaceae bacterium]